eukprot:m.167627 g.167627  ORF g.167627 m.167627 type:complete len:70 (-) comp53176_c0_seq1:110-319(-)
MVVSRKQSLRKERALQCTREQTNSNNNNKATQRVQFSAGGALFCLALRSARSARCLEVLYAPTAMMDEQ